jgi:hypothetical protein
MSGESLHRDSQSWLQDVVRNESSVDQLRASLTQWNASGEVLQSHLESSLLPGIETRTHAWSDTHFFQAAEIARRNFSLLRAENLLSIREHLQAQGVIGFVKEESLAAPTAGSSNGGRASSASYVPPDALIAAVAAGDVVRIRTMLGLELAATRNDSSDLHAIMQWVSGAAPGTFLAYEEGHFKGPLLEDTGDWTVRYFDEQTFFLEANFSRERFLHLVEVRQHLRAQGTAGFVAAAKQGAPTHRPVTTLSRTQGEPETGAQPESSTRPPRNIARLVALAIAAGLAALAAYLLGMRR